MSKSKFILSIISFWIIINIIMLILSYFLIIKLNIFDLKFYEIFPKETKIINHKIIEEKSWEYLQLKDLQNDIVKAIENSSNSVVSIIITKDLKVYYEDPFDFFWWWRVEEKTQKIWWWSGIIISKDWYIITNKHVVQDPNADYTVVTRDWENYKVEKIWLDPVLDIAILKILNDKSQIPENLQPANIWSIKDKIKIWQLVIAIWNALAEFQNTATFGIISWKWRTLNPNENNSTYIWLYQTDTAINPWNSWWPLLDINWNVIWINTAISSFWQNIWFTIPINQEFIDQTLETIKEKWKIIRPFIWISYVELNKWLIKNLNIDNIDWILVNEVVKWSNAEKYWIMKNDIITEINWYKIDQDNSFLYNLYTHKVWDEIIFKIFSWWKYRDLKIILWEYN